LKLALLTNRCLTRDFPDLTDFPEYVILWDASNYTEIPQIN
jgi:hypothetical protein